jgi:hypothetical protein
MPFPITSSVGSENTFNAISVLKAQGGFGRERLWGGECHRCGDKSDLTGNVDTLINLSWHVRKGQVVLKSRSDLDGLGVWTDVRRSPIAQALDVQALTFGGYIEFAILTSYDFHPYACWSWKVQCNTCSSRRAGTEEGIVYSIDGGEEGDVGQ